MLNLNLNPWSHFIGVLCGSIIRR